MNLRLNEHGIRMSNDEIDEQLGTNKGLTFFGGKDGFDYICFNDKGMIVCSGKKDDMIKYAEKANLAVGILIPVKFTTPHPMGDK